MKHSIRVGKTTIICYTKGKTSHGLISTLLISRISLHIKIFLLDPYDSKIYVGKEASRKLCFDYTEADCGICRSHGSI